MPLKNYESSSPMPNIFAAIQKTLLAHKAKQVTFDYDDNGRTIGIAFVIDTNGGPIQIKLPAQFDRVQAIFDKQGLRYRPEQPYRTAWATLRDWLEAQMALHDWGMVKMEQVFLPYMTTKNGQTFFETIEHQNFMLYSGAEEGKIL